MSDPLEKQELSFAICQGQDVEESFISEIFLSEMIS